jgi:hypothetical protein
MTRAPSKAPRGPGAAALEPCSVHTIPGILHPGSWITLHGSGARAVVSVANCGSTVVAPCNRPRRFLRLGLGLVLGWTLFHYVLHGESWRNQQYERTGLDS